MSTLYPGAIDGYAQIRVVRDGIDEIIAGDHNDLRSALIAIEQTLGINPQGAFGTVVARLNDAYANLAAHVAGNPPRHQDTVIISAARSGTPFSLADGTVGSQLTSLLSDLNSISAFTGLTDTPSTYSGSGTEVVRVNAGATALEFFDIDPLFNFLNLSDTPSSFAGQALKNVRVNAGAAALEFVTPTFLVLNDTPSSFSGQSLQSVRVNAGETALEFFTPAAGTFISLSDTPGTFSGQANKLVRVNAGETALEFITAAAGVTDFVDLADTPSNYTGQGNKVVSVNSGETGLEFGEELPSNFLQKAFDSFVVEGMDAYNSSGLNVHVNPGFIASNGRLLKFDGQELVTPGASNTYYVSATIVGDTVTLVGPTATVATAIGTAVNHNVLLFKFTHNGAAWTDSVDIRRYGMLTNNKNHFTVGRAVSGDDGYGADFPTLRSAVEHVRALNGGVVKISPTKLSLVSDLSISTAAEMDILVDYTLEIDGCNKTISITDVDLPIFDITSSFVTIRDLNATWFFSGPPLLASFAKIGDGADVTDVTIDGCRQTDTSMTAADRVQYFIRCGNSAGSNSVTGLVVTNNVAQVNSSGVGLLKSTATATSVIENSIISNNRFYQANDTADWIAAGAALCIRVGNFCVVDGNIISGGFGTGIEAEYGESVIITNNLINGGTGTAAGAGTPLMAVGIGVQASGVGASHRCLIDGNIVKGTTTYGIDDRVGGTPSAADVVISNNIVDNTFDTGLSQAGIRGRGIETLITNNEILNAGAFGVTNASLCIGNKISGGSAGFGSAIDVNGSANIVANNTLLSCPGIGVDIGANAENLVINNTMLGTSTSSVGVASAGIDCIVSGNYIRDYDPTLIGSSVITISSARVMCSNNIIEDCTASGIDVNSNADCLISNNYMNGVATSPTNGIVDLGPGSTATGNYIRGYGASSSFGIESDGTGTVIEGNTIEEPNVAMAAGIKVGNNDFVLVANNHIGVGTAITLAGIDMGTCDQCMVVGNYIRGTGVNNASGGGIINGGNESIISNNRIHQATNSGIILTQDEVVVVGNFIDDPAGHGIEVGTGGDWSVISANYVITPDNDGIHLDGGASNCIISGNFIKEATQGINLPASGSDRCNIVGNFTYLCSDDGIRIEAGSDECNVVGNYSYDDADEGIICAASNANIVGNYINLSGATAIRCTGSFCNISENNILSSTSHGIEVTAGFNTINANLIRLAGGTGIIAAIGSSVISNNNIISPTFIGIGTSGGGANCVVSGNYMINTTNGIFMGSVAHESIVIGNQIENPSSTGLYNTSDRISVIGNQVQDYDTTGIFVCGSTHPLVMGNRTINPNGVATNQTGLDIENTVGALVVGNWCQGKGTGSASMGIRNVTSVTDDVQTSNLTTGGDTPSGYSTGADDIAHCYRI